MKKIEIFGLLQGYIGLLVMLFITMTTITDGLSQEQFTAASVLTAGIGLVIIYKSKRYMRL